MSPPSPPSSLAGARLARSRDSLREAIRASKPSDADRVATPDWLQGLDGLKALPGFDAVLVALRVWWSQQPLRLAVAALSDTATAVLKPLAQRHPLHFTLGGLAVGALLVKLKPWRWLPVAAIMSGLAPQALGKLLGTLPLQSWLAFAASSMAAQNQHKPPA